MAADRSACTREKAYNSFRFAGEFRRCLELLLYEFSLPVVFQP
jgi:predicted glycosyltransferase involved in capsule biosynthesis